MAITITKLGDVSKHILYCLREYLVVLCYTIRNTFSLAGSAYDRYMYNNSKKLVFGIT